MTEFKEYHDFGSGQGCSKAVNDNPILNVYLFAKKCFSLLTICVVLA